MYQKLPGYIRDTPVTRAWFALGEGDLSRALDLFATVISRDPQRFGYLRFVRASAAFGRALVENAAFSPAHAMLAELAMNARDTTTALMEYGLATETDSTDVELILGMGRAYLQARRPADAATQFQRAVQLEPLYAEPYLRLASALEAKGDKAAASRAYVQFLQRVTQDDYRRGDIQHRIQLLAAASP